MESIMKILILKGLSEKISELPEEIRNHIYEYNSLHRKNFYWCLRQIQEEPYICEVCNKRIIKNKIYSTRRGNEVCCSLECVDSLGYIHAFEH